MYELSVKSDFAASHYLRGYDGKCRDLHGHTWKVEVVLQKSKLNTIGMVVDFTVMKKKLREFLEDIDHHHLNDLPVFKKVNPTTENLAKYIFDGFSKECRPFKVAKVIVWESDNASIVYSR